jgi:hypothetical protein
LTGLEKRKLLAEQGMEWVGYSKTSLCTITTGCT